MAELSSTLALGVDLGVLVDLRALANVKEACGLKGACGPAPGGNGASLRSLDSAGQKTQKVGSTALPTVYRYGIRTRSDSAHKHWCQGAVMSCQRAIQGIVLFPSISAGILHLCWNRPSFRMHAYFQSIFRIQNFQHSEIVHLFSMCIFSQISYSESAHALNY